MGAMLTLSAAHAFVGDSDLNQSATELAEVVIEILALNPRDAVDRLIARGPHHRRPRRQREHRDRASERSHRLSPRRSRPQRGGGGYAQGRLNRACRAAQAASPARARRALRRRHRGTSRSGTPVRRPGRTARPESRTLPGLDPSAGASAYISGGRTAASPGARIRFRPDRSLAIVPRAGRPHGDRSNPCSRALTDFPLPTPELTACSNASPTCSGSS